MSSSTAMPSSRSTERGKCLSQLSTQKSELNSPVPLKKTRTESTQLLDPSLRQSRAMILRQPWQLGEERELESDTEPSLLSRMSRNPRLTRNLSDEEPVAKKTKVDESAFTWTGPESQLPD